MPGALPCFFLCVFAAGRAQAFNSTGRAPLLGLHAFSIHRNAIIDDAVALAADDKVIELFERVVCD